MKITILTVGKKDDPKYSDAIEDFTRRARHYFDIHWKILPGSKNISSPIELQKKEEAEKILEKIEEKDFVILLDERGNSISSLTLADLFIKHTDIGTKQIIIIIGGAFGVSDQVLARANFTLSLSKLVFPHQLVRLMIIEQIYRSGTIMKNEKYHHI